MKRRDKGWGEADSQRAQSTSQPAQESKARVDRPARSAVHLHVLVYFCTRTLAVMETLLVWAKSTRDQVHTCLAVPLSLYTRETRRDMLSRAL
jgi:hypothetical protein